MSTAETLVIQNVHPGQKIEHDGSIVFKCFVPDGVQAFAQKGGILLELGGGNQLTLKAENGNSFNMSASSISSNTIIINGTVIIGGSTSFNQASPKEAITGVTSKGTLGHHVTIQSDTSVTLADAKSNLHVKTAASFHGGDIGENAHISTGSSFHGHALGSGANISAGASIHAANIGSGSKLSAGASAHVENIAADTTISAGGSIHGENAASGVKLSAGGSIKLESAEPGVSTSAGGSVKIKNQKTPSPGKKNGGWLKF